MKTVKEIIIILVPLLMVGLGLWGIVVLTFVILE